MGWRRPRTSDPRPSSHSGPRLLRPAAVLLQVPGLVAASLGNRLAESLHGFPCVTGKGQANDLHHFLNLSIGRRGLPLRTGIRLIRIAWALRLCGPGRFEEALSFSSSSTHAVLAW